MPIPTHVHWYELHRDCDKFANKLRYRANNYEKEIEKDLLENDHNEASMPLPPPQKANLNAPNFRLRKTQFEQLESFIEAVEKEVFDANNLRKVKLNLNKDELSAIREIKEWDDKTLRIQDKGSRFVVLDTESYKEKVLSQIDAGQYERIDRDLSTENLVVVDQWAKIWYDKG